MDSLGVPSPSTGLRESRTPSPLLPTNSKQFIFACRCLNVQVEDRVPLDFEADQTASSSSVPQNGGTEEKAGNPQEWKRVWIGHSGEVTKFGAFVVWDQEEETSDEADPGRRQASRRCTLCDTHCYRSRGKLKGDPPVEDAWVDVNLQSGILWGEKLDQALQPSPSRLPFSSLLLPLPTQASTSTFGRPPQQTAPDPYPAISPSATSPTAAASHFAIPPVLDPFFLPPPFIPSHPLLRDLCSQASTYLNESHARLEDDVKAYVAAKTREMRNLEDNVRGEVEMLWQRYQAGVGKGEQVERISSSERISDLRRTNSSSRQTFPSHLTTVSSPVSPPSTSTSARAQSARDPDAGVVGSLINSMPVDAPPNDPMLGNDSPSDLPPVAASLLSASLKTNSFRVPPPRQAYQTEQKTEMSETIEALSKQFGRDTEAKSIAMSYAFSNFDENMGRSRASRTAPSTTEQSSQPAQEQVPRDDRKDSWIDDERVLSNALQEGAAMQATGTDAGVGERQDSKSGPPKQKRDRVKSVKFEEPPKEVAEALEEEEAAEAVDFVPLAEDDYVFDFELGPEDGESQEATPANGNHEDVKDRTRNILEANLSSTFAADAPSHRSAWKRLEKEGVSYVSVKGGDDAENAADEEADESRISKLATSVPIGIGLPGGRGGPRSAPPLPLERKTSLSDREDILVPSLLAAMKQRGVNIPASALVTNDRMSRSRATSGQSLRRTSRSGSASRDRDRDRDHARSYSQDPGAVFESLADTVKEEDEDAEEGIEEGTLRESKFLPPHVLARKESLGEPDVGWRSMAD